MKGADIRAGFGMAAAGGGSLENSPHFSSRDPLVQDSVDGDKSLPVWVMVLNSGAFKSSHAILGCHGTLLFMFCIARTV